MKLSDGRLGSRLFDVFNLVLSGLFAFICVYPVIHVLSSSFSDPSRLAVHTGGVLWPLGFSLDGYRVVLRNPNIWTGYGNTLFYVVVGTILCLFMTSIGAYVLSRRNFMFRKHMTLLIVFTMYFSGGMIPNFLLVRILGLYNTRGAIIVPALISTWNLFVLKTAFQSVPASLEESAKLDGANDLLILFRIILPVSKATIAVIALYYSVSHWNAWFHAMIYLRKRELFPLQLILREILIISDAGGNISGDMPGDVAQMFIDKLIKHCTIIVSTLPILSIYPFIQKYFVKGVMMGSLIG